MSRTLIVIAVTLLGVVPYKSQSDQVIEKCNSEALHSIKMNDTEFVEIYSQKLVEVKKYIADNSIDGKMSDCEQAVLIPVAIHFQNTTIEEDCLREMALDQIEILNRAFAATNENIWQWTAAENSGFYDEVSIRESCIQFCLPTENHPEGYGIQDGDYAITINTTSGDNNKAWAGYLNCYVRNMGPGILGYSPLGGNLFGDGVSLNIIAFSSISCGGNEINSNYNLGKNMSHQIGHYLFLNHPFSNGSCSVDGDGISDTPRSDVPSYECQQFGDANCTEPHLWMNYMDYAFDSCITMYTEGQIDHMEAYVMTNFQEALDTFNLDCINPLDNVVEINLSVMLQGPYDPGTGLMTDHLRIANVIPILEPFSELGYSHVGSGGEVVTSGILDEGEDEAIVDWIWIEIRDGNVPTEVVITKPCLIQRNGSVVDVNGNPELSFVLPESESFLVAVRHANHLGFRNLVPTNNDPGVVHSFNMTDQSQALYGTDALNMVDGMMMMISGEGNSDGQVNSIDLNNVWRSHNGLPYDYIEGRADFNLDRYINAVDQNFYWRPNMSKIEQLD